MKIAITGATGLVGSAATSALHAAGHTVVRLVRRPVQAADEIAWDPAAGKLDPASLEGVDAIINLAGENIGAGRWTAARRERIRRSREDVTRTLTDTLPALARKPRVLLNASAIGFYGDRGDEVLTETSEPGRGFLAEVCFAWEALAERATAVGVRVVRLRFAPIVTGRGGMLAKMLPLFRLGLGGRLGSGQQWMSWVSLEDVVGAMQHALSDVRCTGPINVAAPAPVTNADFTRILARALRRPAILPVPAWTLRVAVGRKMAEEALLASIRVAPRRLIETGYAFRHATLDAALRDVLGPRQL